MCLLRRATADLVYCGRVSHPPWLQWGTWTFQGVSISALYRIKMKNKLDMVNISPTWDCMWIPSVCYIKQQLVHGDFGNSNDLSCIQRVQNCLFATLGSSGQWRDPKMLRSLEFTVFQRLALRSKTFGEHVVLMNGMQEALRTSLNRHWLWWSCKDSLLGVCVETERCSLACPGPRSPSGLCQWLSIGLYLAALSTAGVAWFGVNCHTRWTARTLE